MIKGGWLVGVQCWWPRHGYINLWVSLGNCSAPGELVHVYLNRLKRSPHPHMVRWRSSVWVWDVNSRAKKDPDTASRNSKVHGNHMSKGWSATLNIDKALIHKNDSISSSAIPPPSARVQTTNPQGSAFSVPRLGLTQATQLAETPTVPSRRAPVPVVSSGHVWFAEDSWDLMGFKEP